MARAKQADVFISVAAVADYQSGRSKPHKIKRGNGNLNVELAPNPDILGEVRRVAERPFCVGFAAETEDLKQTRKRSARKRESRSSPRTSRTRLSARTPTALTLFDDDGLHELVRAPKIVLARQLVAQHREDAATALALFV